MFKPGDLVMIVKPTPCCGNDSAVGHIFTVVAGEVPNIGWCRYCGDKGPAHRFGSMVSLSQGICQAYRLKLIPPLTEQESFEQEDFLELLK